MKILVIVNLMWFIYGCSSMEQRTIQTTVGKETVIPGAIWLSHEHILVDFIGADSIRPAEWNRDSIVNTMLRYLKELKEFQVTYFVDATPQYLGRDALLLSRLSELEGLHILTNTGYYGARKNRYLPEKIKKLSSEEIAGLWIDEVKYGIDGSDLKPGFIKIGVDNASPLDTIHQKIVDAAALTHIETGLPIASHTGQAKALWPQLHILKERNVAPQHFIWVHAQNENELSNYLKAAEIGCWISLDGIGWGWEKYVDKLVYAKENGILNHILISHDAGWFDPQKPVQNIQPYTTIFKQLIPELKARGFEDSDINLLLSVNPSKAYSIKTN
ncbi:MAG: phosphotriesterase [Flavobacteriaceae bacterium]